MIIFRTARVGYIEKAIDIYSRKGAENAKEGNKTILSLQQTHVSSAFSAPLRENSMLNLQHLYFQLDVTLAAIIAGLIMFIARLLAIYYNISLPRFRFKFETDL